jgi:hypothetical protein
MLLVGLAMAACGSSVASDAPGGTEAVTPVTTVVASAAGDLLSEVEAACAATTYSNCLQSVAMAIPVLSGSLVAICEYGGGSGDVVPIDAEADAETSCSDGGAITPSRVVTIIRIP